MSVMILNSLLILIKDKLWILNVLNGKPAIEIYPNLKENALHHSKDGVIIVAINILELFINLKFLFVNPTV